SLDALNQSIHFFSGVVESERSARRGRDAEALHYRLGAVMPGSDSNSLLVEDGPDVVRVDTVQQEREHTRLFSCGADQTNTRDCGKGVSGIGQQLVLIGGYVVHPQTIHIIDGCAQPDGT